MQEAPTYTCDTFLFHSERADLLSDAVVLQYVGFEAKDSVREYTFTLRGTGGVTSNYFVTIANAAFAAHRLHYQDGPDICSLRLRREFASKIEHPPSTCFSVTDAELAQYEDAHAPKAKPGAYVPAQREEA